LQKLTLISTIHTKVNLEIIREEETDGIVNASAYIINKNIKEQGL
jgi:hypothetical protein